MKIKIISLLLAIVMIVGMLPLSAIPAFAEETTGGTEKYIVRDWDDTEKKVTEKEEDIPTGAIPIATDTTVLDAGKWYFVPNNVTVSEQITVNGTESSPTNLILMDGCTLTVENGILLQDNCSMNIYGQKEGTGNLIVAADPISDCIGSASNDMKGSVTVYGGTVEATGGIFYSGIACHTTVYGGTVTGNGGEKGVGIFGNLYVYGGTVNATGQNAVCGMVRLYGGTVNATGSASPDSISIGIRGDVNVYAGTVNAASNDRAISGNVIVESGDVEANGIEYGIGGDVTVNGGTVNAAGKEGVSGNLFVNGGRVSVIGSRCGVYGNLYVYGGTTSVSASDNIGICNNLYVYGGIVTVIGAQNGIGGFLKSDSFGVVFAGSSKDNAKLVDGYNNQKYVEVHFHTSDTIRSIGTAQHECLYCDAVEDHLFVDHICRCGEIETLNVTFDMQGHGISVEDQFIKAFTKVQRPTEPTDESYVFDGWFTEPECITPWDFDTVTITQDTVIYAKWVIGSCDVRFILSGGKGGAATVAHYGKALENIEIPTKDGLVFYGYYDFDGVKYFDANGNGVKVWDKETAEDVLIAYWVEASTHVHTFSEDYTYDENHHWRVCTCEDEKCKNLVDDFAVHTFTVVTNADGSKTCTCVCGYTKVVYDKPDDEGEIISGTTYTGISLTLGSDIAINFYMELSEEARQSGTMTFDIGGRIVTGGEVQYNETEKRYYFRTPLTALEMAETVTATFNFNGIDYIQEYSVAEYIDTIVGNPDKYGKEAVALAKKIANYGYYAQVYLASIHSNVTIGKDGYEKMDKFDDVDIDVEKAIEALANYKVTVSGTSDNLSLYGSTVYFDSATALNYYVTVKDGEEPTATAVNTVTGEEKQVEIKLYKGNIYIVSVKDITATELADDIKVTINNEITLTGSVFAYCNSVVQAHNIDGATEKDTFAVNVMAAFYEYYEAAVEYAETQD